MTVVPLQSDYWTVLAIVGCGQFVRFTRLGNLVMLLKSVQANELRENLVINMRDFRLLPSLEDRTDMLSRNLGTELPLLAA